MRGGRRLKFTAGELEQGFAGTCRIDSSKSYINLPVGQNVDFEHIMYKWEKSIFCQGEHIILQVELFSTFTSTNP